MQVASQISKFIKIFGPQSASVRLVTEHWDGSHVYAAFPLRQALNMFLTISWDNRLSPGEVWYAMTQMESRTENRRLEFWVQNNKP
jgi:hypothetical protein